MVEAKIAPVGPIVVKDIVSVAGVGKRVVIVKIERMCSEGLGQSTPARRGASWSKDAQKFRMTTARTLPDRKNIGVV
jgi:hypothetical protein